jgi:hypothetical protein
VQNFDLQQLAQFMAEKSLPQADMCLMRVGVDDVHGALKFVFGLPAVSLHLNMFGYDDEELNDEVMKLAMNPAVSAFITLDKSQAGGVHEKKLLAADQATPEGLRAFGTSFAVGQSGTHSISHTKGGTLDGVLAFEGSTNWSADGEGTFVMKGAPGGPRYKAQNNTLVFFNNQYFVHLFETELAREHAVAVAQVQKTPAPNSVGTQK